MAMKDAIPGEESGRSNGIRIWNRAGGRFFFYGDLKAALACITSFFFERALFGTFGHESSASSGRGATNTLFEAGFEPVLDQYSPEGVLDDAWGLGLRRHDVLTANIIQLGAI
jgi:hypothetical protein